MALAEALSASPSWSEVADAMIVVRPHPPFGLAVLGHFDDAEAARLIMLPVQLEVELPRLRYVDYAQAELDCEALAQELVDRFGREEIRSMAFTAIPRGGLIVLGMLSYVLDLKRSHLTADAPGGRPVVVVDDCSLTGVRFRQFLDSSKVSPVVFAHLYSHADLRRAIETNDARVIGAVAAQDLVDYAPEIFGADYSEWRQRWQERGDGGAYWVGRTGPLCFAWSEPEFTFWNPVTAQEEVGWRLVPPGACLKNRLTSGTSPVQVHVQPSGVGRLRPAGRTFYGDAKDDVIVANLDTRQVVRLGGVAADMWREVIRRGEPEAAVRALECMYDASATQLRADLDQLVVQLCYNGFIVDYQQVSEIST